GRGRLVPGAVPARLRRGAEAGGGGGARSERPVRSEGRQAAARSHRCRDREDPGRRERALPLRSADGGDAVRGQAQKGGRAAGIARAHALLRRHAAARRGALAVPLPLRGAEMSPAPAAALLAGLVAAALLADRTESVAAIAV